MNISSERSGREGGPPGEHHGGSATWIDLRRRAEWPRGAVWPAGSGAPLITHLASRSPRLAGQLLLSSYHIVHK